MCVALGAATTLLLAWVLAVRVVVPLSGMTGRVQAAGLHVLSDDSGWYCQVLKRPGLTVVSWNRDVGERLLLSRTAGGPMVMEVGPAGPYRVRGQAIDSSSVPSWARPPADLRATTATPGAMGACSARGWPLRALWYEATFGNPAARVNRGGIPVPEVLQRFGQGPVLPCRVLAVGFALDTAFWAASWWLLSALAVLIRKSLRTREGHCRVCGYDLRGAAHVRCPECGAGAEAGVGAVAPGAT